MMKYRPAILLSACALAASAALIPLNASAADADGTTGSTASRYLSGSVIWTEDHTYDDWGRETSLNVGTGEGAGQLSVQNGARVEVAGALFIAGKGYGSSWSVEEGHDGLVLVGPGSVLECGSQARTAVDAHVYVGWGSGVKGTLRVDGGEFIANYMLNVGCHEGSDGLMEVLNGGHATLRLSEYVADAGASFLSVARAPGSRGLLRVDGGSVLEFAVNPGELTRADIGTGGEGTLVVAGNSRVSLGQDFAFIGVESGSHGLVHVLGGSTLELPRVAYLAHEEGATGELLVEGSGTRLSAQDVVVAEQGAASLTLQEGATAELSGRMWVGTGSGAGQVSVLSGAQLASAGATVVGSQGHLQLAGGGQWVSESPVLVLGGGRVSVQGASRWEARGDVDFEAGATLSLRVESAAQAPEIVVAPGAVLTMVSGSRLQLTLSPELLGAAAQGEFELPLISGDWVGEDYEYELRDESGLFDASGLGQLSDGRWGLSLSLDRPALQRVLEDDAARLAHGLWSSTGVVQDFTSALMARPQRGCGRHLWGMGLGSFSHMGAQGSCPGYDFNGGGYAVGADTCLHEHSTLGFSFGQIYGHNKSSDGITRIHQNSLMGALYARYNSCPGEEGRRLVLDAYAAYARTRNRARSAMYAQGLGRSSGHWSDDVYALGFRVSGERPLTERVSLLPFIGLRYVHGSHGRLSMLSAEAAREYSSAALHNLSLPMGATLRARYAFGRAQEFCPELTLAYVWDLSRHNPRLSTSMLGEGARSAGYAPGRHALMLRTGAAWMLNEHWSTGLYYHLECRRHALDQLVDMSVSYGF